MNSSISVHFVPGFLIVVLFLTVTIFYTNNSKAITIGGDTYGNLAIYKQTRNNLAKEKTCDCFSEDNNSSIPNYIFESTVLALSKIATKSASYINLHLLLFFLLPFVAIYYILVRSLRDFKYKIFISALYALAISLSSYNIYHFLAGHYALNLFFVVLWLASLNYLFNKEDVNSAILNGFFYGLMFIYNPYYGYFGLFIYFTLSLYVAFYYKNKLYSFAKNVFIAAVITSLILLFNFYTVIDILAIANTQDIDSSYNRSRESLAGAMPYMYFLPPPNHVYVTENYSEWYRNVMRLANVPENALYLGIFNLIFFPYSCYLFLKRKLADKNKENFRLVFILTVVLFALSLPPYIPIGGNEKILWVSSYLHDIFPMFRMYARAGVFVLIFVTLGSLIGLVYLLNTKEKYQKQIIIAICVMFLVDHAQNIPYITTNEIPKVYSWLKSDEAKYSIYEIPELPQYSEKDLFQFYKFLYYQTYHGKKLVNRGAISPNIDNYTLYKELKKRKVKYVLQHTNNYSEGLIPKEYKNYVHPMVAAEKYNLGKIKELPSWYEFYTSIDSVNVYRLK